jgi:hypothetical protein
MYTRSRFPGSLIYLTDRRTFTLSLGLRCYQSQHVGAERRLLMVASTTTVAPFTRSG